MHNLLSRVRKSPLLLAALIATTLAGTPVLAHAEDHGLLMDLGGRAFLGNRNVPRESSPLAAHLGADYFRRSSSKVLFIGGRFDTFLLTPPGVHANISRGTIGLGDVTHEVNLKQLFVGFRHVNDMKNSVGVLGSSGGPIVGYSQRYGTGDMHVFWEVAALSYLYSHGGGRVGVEGRLRLAYIFGTLEWYLRFDPATGSEFGVGLGGADATMFWVGPDTERQQAQRVG
jgi:hypothetical protein